MGGADWISPQSWQIPEIQRTPEPLHRELVNGYIRFLFLDIRQFETIAFLFIFGF
jgi:hypothetical protein